MTQFLRIDNRIRLPVLPCGTEFKHYLTKLGLIKDVINLIWSYMDVYVETEFCNIFTRLFRIGDSDDFIQYRQGSINYNPITLHDPDNNNDYTTNFNYALTIKNGLNCDWVTLYYTPFEKVIYRGSNGVYPLNLTGAHDEILMFWSYQWCCLKCVESNGGDYKDLLIGRGFYVQNIIKAKDGDKLTQDGWTHVGHSKCQPMLNDNARIRITIKNGAKLIELLPNHH